MSISNYMKRSVISIPETSTIRDAASILVKNHIGLLPIVDKDNKLVGVVGMRDLISLVMPDFVNFIIDVDFVHDFGAVETTRLPANVLNQSIQTLMKPAISAPENSGLLRAYSLMLQSNLHDVPVVSSNGTLLGIASRVDIGAGILSSWARVD
ncbi:MAG: CBS domain-containing protein [Anaerolineales bacterium]